MSTCFELHKCPAVYQKMENGTSRHCGGIVRLMMQWKIKGDCGRSGKICGSKENILAKKLAWQRVFATKKKAGKEKMKDIETDTYIILSYRVGIKVSWFLNHKSSSWSHKPKICKTSIFHKLFYLKYNVFKIICIDNICLPISLKLRLNNERKKFHRMVWIVLNCVVIQD